MNIVKHTSIIFWEINRLGYRLLSFGGATLYIFVVNRELSSVIRTVQAWSGAMFASRDAEVAWPHSPWFARKWTESMLWCEGRITRNHHDFIWETRWKIRFRCSRRNKSIDVDPICTFGAIWQGRTVYFGGCDFTGEYHGNFDEHLIGNWKHLNLLEISISEFLVKISWDDHNHASVG